VYEAIKAGAMGYLLKDVPATELVATIHQVHAGEPSIQPKIANKLLIELGRKGRPEASSSHTPPRDALSPREIEIVKLLAEGASNRKIAETLILAEGTVKNHVSNILSKLHSENRTQAAHLARERKLLWKGENMSIHFDMERDNKNFLRIFRRMIMISATVVGISLTATTFAILKSNPVYMHQKIPKASPSALVSSQEGDGLGKRDTVSPLECGGSLGFRQLWICTPATDQPSKKPLQRKVMLALHWTLSL
jgi:DNA-binding CsgD family transcriptional regulator